MFSNIAVPTVVKIAIVDRVAVPTVIRETTLACHSADPRTAAGGSAFCQNLVGVLAATSWLG